MKTLNRQWSQILKTTFLFVGAILLCLVGSSSSESQNRRRLAPQSPSDLCQCSADESSTRGGYRTFEEFKGAFRGEFKTADEARLGWEVYQAANRCNAQVIIGRLADTGSYENQPGYCVLRGLVGWTMAINRAFIRGGTDRGARFVLTSQMPFETMNDLDDGPVPSQVEQDRDTHWKIIYNREIQWVLATGHYSLNYDPNQRITPTNPAHMVTVGKYKAPGGQSTVGQKPVQKVSGHTWVLKSVSVAPEKPYEGWSYTAQSTSAVFKVYNGDRCEFQWTAPPQQIDSNGVNVTFVTRSIPLPKGRLQTLIGASGSGVTSDTPPSEQLVYASAENGVPATGQKTVRFIPQPNATDIEIRVGLQWAITFYYKYKRVD